jgi:hypothetical protein
MRTIADETDGLVIGALANHHGVAVVYLADGTQVKRAGDLTETYHPVGDCSCSSWPPADRGDYARIAAELGFGADLGAYNFEHELCHVLVPRALFGERGYVSWMAASGRKMSLAAAKAEERLIYYVQQAAHQTALDDKFRVLLSDPASQHPSVMVLAVPDPQITHAAEILLAVRRHLAKSAERSGVPA